MIDGVGGLRIEVPDRVIADCREMDHGVEPGKVLALDVADVRLQRGDLRHIIAEGAGGKQVGIEPDDLVAGPLEHGDEH